MLLSQSPTNWSTKNSTPDDSVIPVGNTHIGPGTMTVMAGPCAIESKEQLLSTAFAVKKAGATFLRGGAYKPRTSPYSFQGLEEEGLKYMKEAQRSDRTERDLRSYQCPCH